MNTPAAVDLTPEEERAIAALKRPADFPESFVMRRWELNADNDVLPTTWLVTAATIEELREQVPFGFYPFGHMPSEDPCIVETWIG